MNFVAHVRQEEDGTWKTQILRDHLEGTARKAASFAAKFGNPDWAKTIAYWHDLGKFNPGWQRHIKTTSGFDRDAHIEGAPGKGNHSSAGAVLAFDEFKKVQFFARALAYSIAGHHAGLPDWDPEDALGDPLPTRVYKNPLNQELDSEILEVIKSLPEAEPFIYCEKPQTVPFGVSSLTAADKEFLHLWIRMLFSCLVDSDFLDTEEFMDPVKAERRTGINSSSGKNTEEIVLPSLKRRFDSFMLRKISKASKTSINEQRKKILETCRKKASLEPGFFSLTVPTGGGKTLSSMAFALEHALQYGKDRVIMAIPYTSIIEQTAKVLKYGTDDDAEIEAIKQRGDWLFGESSVLEHHSNMDPEREDQKNRLAAENWDAPIIVTTNVQLFESLYASRPSRCRKLHNIANSVIILDEAQMVPPEFLKPILSVLRGLVSRFGVTVLLCTATQPALEGTIGSGKSVFTGIPEATEIIDDPRSLAKAFKRVDLSLPKPDSLGRVSWDSLAAELKENDQVLCIVNTRRDCRELHSLMPEGTIHLSGFMCAEERSEIISEVKEKLRKKKPVRVISTQLVEAGVDIDFPVVYRALGGLDSIAQAAGRCNREGNLGAIGKKGRVEVFMSPRTAPPGLLRKGEEASLEMLRKQMFSDIEPELFKEYFKIFYGRVVDFDYPRFEDRLVKEAREFKFQFRTLAHHFNLIDNSGQESIIVEYVGARQGSPNLIKELRYKGASRTLLRKLQRFAVSVPRYLFQELFRKGMVEEVSGFYVQVSPALYRKGLGLLPDESQWSEEVLLV